MLQLRSSLTFAAALAAAWLPAQPAETEASGLPPAPGPAEPQWSLVSDFGVQAAAGLDGYDAEQGGFRASVEVGYTARMPEYGVVNLTGGYRFAESDFSGAAPLLADGPYGDTHTWFGGLRYNQRGEGEWGWMALAGFEAGAEEDADLGEGLTWRGGGGATWYASKDLNLTFGAIARTRLEEDPQVVPVIAVDWKIGQGWRLRTLNGLLLTYDQPGQLPLFWDFSVRYEAHGFRLSDDRADAAAGGAVDERSVPLMVGVAIPLSPHFLIRPWIAANFAGSVEILDANGDDLLEYDLDPNVSGGVMLRGRF